MANKINNRVYMEYIKELERIKLNKERHTIGNRWENAAACRDLELYLQGRLEEAKKLEDHKKATETPLT